MDMGVAYTLARRFFWSENVLWRKDFGDRHITVFLAENDAIVNTDQVRRYLLEAETERETAVDLDGKTGLNDRKMGRRSSTVIWCKNIHHGHVFDSTTWRKRLINEVLQHSVQPYHNHVSRCANGTM
ncbi:hypothetical protein V1506DRAFT_522641 [Lipomyces tetrasporus]